MRTWDRWLVLAVLLLGWSPASWGVSVVLGPPDLTATGALSTCDGLCYYAGMINTALPAGAVLTSPADGTIASWRVHGATTGGGVVRLLAARPQPGGALMASGSSPGSVSTDGVTSNPGGGLQVRAGDTMSVVVQASSMPGWSASVYYVPAPSASFAGIGLYNAGGIATPSSPVTNQVLLYNATVDLFPPSPQTLTPTGGPASGGTTVTITGYHLIELTGVTFDGLPAASFSGTRDPVSGLDTVTAVSPSHAGGPTTVVVSTAGGSSPLGQAFTYEDLVAPSFTALAISPAAFRAANFGGSIADGATRQGIGATVSYLLSETATAAFAVERLAGRGPDCVPPARKRCTRHTAVGSFTHAGASGANQFTFSGRVNDAPLRKGRYRLVGMAEDAAGNQSETGSASFKIRGR